MWRVNKDSSKKLSKFAKWAKRRQKLLVVIVIAVIGTSLLLISQASTGTLAVEPETGTVSSCASKQSNSSASGGEYVKFGCPVAQNDLVIITPDSEFTALKTAVKNGGKKAYWDHLKSKGYIAEPRPVHIPDWSQNMTYYIGDTPYSFDSKSFKADGHPSSSSATAQSIFMSNVALNAYSTALRWRLDDDQANGDHAINLINSWVDNFQDTETHTGPNDGRDNQVRLGSGWFLASFTKAVEVMWDHPNFTTARKQKTADWLWKVFLKEDPKMHEDNSETLGQLSAGWNGRTLFLQARLNAGLVMKAANHPQGEAVVDDTIDSIDDVLPEILYYGKQPWHEVLGQPWPEQPYRSISPVYDNFHTASQTQGYWQFLAGTPSPPPFFVGQTQETGRDVGHIQLGMGSVSEMLRSLRLNGYVNKYSPQEIGDVMLGLGERHAKFYNEALDESWRRGYSKPSLLDRIWEPTEWASLKLKPFVIEGDAADHG